MGLVYVVRRPQKVGFTVRRKHGSHIIMPAQSASPRGFSAVFSGWFSRRGAEAQRKKNVRRARKLLEFALQRNDEGL